MRNREKPFGEKIVTADEAVAAIGNGDSVVFSHAAGVPQEIPQALIRNKERFRDVYIYHMLCLGDGNYLSEGFEKHFRHITDFVGANSRKAIEQVSQKTAAGRRSRHTDYTTRCYGQLQFRCVVRLHKARRRRSACGDSRNEREYALCRRRQLYPHFANRLYRIVC